MRGRFLPTRLSLMLSFAVLASKTFLWLATITVVVIWTDAVRRLVRTTRAFFAWYRSLEPQDRPAPNINLNRFVRLRDILEPRTPSGHTPPLQYRESMRWFLAEALVGLVIIMIAVIAANIF
jgi:hypothetical protein